MTFIDSHSHLYLEEFAEDLPLVIERAKSVGVSAVLLPNIDSTTIGDMLKVCADYKGYCFPMMGLHPTSVNESFEKELEIVEQCLVMPNEYIAIGEVGLDLYWDKTFLQEQLTAFDRQIQLAINYGLPLVIHSRDAFEYIYNAMLPYKGSSLKGIFHSFTGTLYDAERLLEHEGFMLGINGVVTFKKSALPSVLKNIPLDRIVLETDAPYLTPAPNRGKRNESANLKYTLLKVAEIYERSPEYTAETTRANTIKVFGMLK